MEILPIASIAFILASLASILYLALRPGAMLEKRNSQHADAIDLLAAIGSIAFILASLASIFCLALISGVAAPEHNSQYATAVDVLTIVGGVFTVGLLGLATLVWVLELPKATTERSDKD